MRRPHSPALTTFLPLLINPHNGPCPRIQTTSNRRTLHIPKGEEDKSGNGTVRVQKGERALDRTGNCDLTTCCIGHCRPSTSAEITHLPSPTPSVNTPLSSSSSSSAPSSTTTDPPVLQSFTISTKTNVEYDHINQLLHTVHVNRYGDPELNEGWWQQSTDIEMDYMDVDPVNAYQDINATLRQAFLQRHHHP